MPYFHNNQINLLFIHIPKTGGSSLEMYFSKKFKIPLNDASFFGTIKKFNNVSFQHQTYLSLINNPHKFNIDHQNKLKILTVVRCPYTRIISDLFHFKYITVNSSPIDVFKVIAFKYLNSYGANDNHKKPQYLFLLDKERNLLDNITILKMETLNKDMANLGFTDFNLVANSSHIKRDYMSYLNSESIKLINIVYKEDFWHFGYPMVENK